MKAWEPKGGQDAFASRAIELRGKGKTWRKIAEAESVPYDTLFNYFERNAKWKKELDKLAHKETVEQLTQTAVEMAVVKRHPTMIIYLLKAMAGLYDVPKEPVDPDAPKEERLPGMTKEEALRKLKERVGK